MLNCEITFVGASAMRTPIYVETSDGELVPMRPAAPPNEDSLQELVARFPDIIGDAEGGLLLIQREQPISDREDGGGRWSLDHLFVTRDGVPVLVEIKRAADTRLRREVVGQLLDYAANGAAYWRDGATELAFTETCLRDDIDPEEKLAAFLSEPDGVEGFWSKVDANFRAGTMRLVFVADEIPRELARIVEFLNEQMTAEVIAVELRYYESETGARTLAPRIIGQTARTQDKAGRAEAPPPITENEWIERHLSPHGEQTVEAFKSLVALLRSRGAEVDSVRSQKSYYVEVTSPDGNRRYPFQLDKNGRVEINFGFLTTRPGLKDPAVRAMFVRRFDDAVGPLSNQNANGHPAFPMSRLADKAVADKFEAVADDWIAASRQ